jgi:lipopolysaccharide transport system ATP-binding protein
LAFAVAAHLDPEIMLVDEVLAVGDAAFQQKCLGTLNEVSRQGRTILFVSHDLGAISSLCTNAIWLEQGRLAAIGPTDMIIGQYLNSIQGNLDTPLSHRQDRSGNGLIRFNEIRIENMFEKKLNVIQSGSDVRFILGYESETKVPLRNVKAAILFHDSLGKLIFICRSDLPTSSFQHATLESHFFECTIPNLPLCPGDYHISIWAKIGGIWADRIDHAASFSVSPGDFFGTGRLPKAGEGNILVNHNWGFR